MTSSYHSNQFKSPLKNFFITQTPPSLPIYNHINYNAEPSVATGVLRLVNRSFYFLRQFYLPLRQKEKVDLTFEVYFQCFDLKSYSIDTSNRN